MAVQPELGLLPKRRPGIGGGDFVGADSVRQSLRGKKKFASSDGERQGCRSLFFKGWCRERDCGRKEGRLLRGAPDAEFCEGAVAGTMSVGMLATA